MDIKHVTLAKAVYDQQPLKKKQTNEEQSASVKDDSIQLSPEALQRYQSDETKKLDAVQQRLDSGFYFTDEVTEKVADIIGKRFSHS